MARGEWARAAELFARAYDKGPSLETAWLLGDAREAAGDAKGAEEAYALVAKDAASDARTYSLFLSARKDRSKEQYSEALRLASEVHVKRFDVYTEDALAWALFRAGMLETAKTSLGRARRLHTPDALLFFHEGAIRIAAGDVKKGKELLEKALATNGAFDWRGAKEARELLRK
jgi:tetratricopeptide (TPR) repeat protein